MELFHHIENGVCIILVEGDINIFTVSKMRVDLTFILKQQKLKTLVLNLEEVPSVDSSGIILILTLYRELQEQDVQLVLCQVNDNIMRCFNKTQLDKIFRVSRRCECGEDCLQCLEGQA
ncbi:MAG: STAS domain-containing protein [SAR324 cluster bacterium]|nr:STAS domain-containing protein [SAR324 cluster bacterium]